MRINIILHLSIILSSCGNEKPSVTIEERADTSNFNAAGVEKASTHTVSKHTRRNANTAQAEKDLAALEKAMVIMRQMDCSNPLSWYYQGAIHWIPNNIPNNPLCKSYTSSKDLKEGWDNCTHAEGVQIHFLAWHRLYIYHFEKIVRKLSGYEDFALPYWGYADTVNQELNRTMPTIFRNKSSSLFENCREGSLNNGLPISGPGARILVINNLFENETFSSFNADLDNGTHGGMHNYIGRGNDRTGRLRFQNPISNTITPTGLMGSVSTAAFDPVFWIHHANIDRIWQQWTNSPNGKNMSLEELKSANWAYAFYDENGKRVVYKAEDIEKILYDLEYDYDDTPVIKKSDLGLLKNSEIKLFGDTLISKKINAKITNTLTTLSIPNDKSKTKNVNLFNESAGNILKMSITVSFTQTPNGNYEVYLNLPKNETATPKSKYFSGFMNFFGADHKHNKGQHEHHHEGKIIKTFTFEVTTEAKASDALNKNKFDISVLQFNGLPAESITIEKIAFFKP